jgi:hypothetical protein
VWSSARGVPDLSLSTAKTVRLGSRTGQLSSTAPTPMAGLAINRARWRGNAGQRGCLAASRRHGRKPRVDHIATRTRLWPRGRGAVRIATAPDPGIPHHAFLDVGAGTAGLLGHVAKPGLKPRVPTHPRHGRDCGHVGGAACENRRLTPGQPPHHAFRDVGGDGSPA